MLSAPVCLQNAVFIQVQEVSRILQNPCCSGKGHQCPEGEKFTSLIYPRSRVHHTATPPLSTKPRESVNVVSTAFLENSPVGHLGSADSCHFTRSS